ncbi:HEPN domain-containing protein [Amphritea sp. 1_MG-2023]|uniref:HEPN domain-containing protein n=1 Tax=Amphritea sp. 1_MG-2023 TaxID=3062670 RepID=UPI0026E2E073|nr:HEPN domain-containing protein [Amphritea sp. 1_MG-2023]MDO6564549.1 HEPN domain-containing protein [Amphritea sp. 1_MG-2023]
MTHRQLKQKHRALRKGFHLNLSLRTHRALSWLDRAEHSHDDADGQFIFLWISFNAAYATDIEEQYRTTEKGMFEAFFKKLVDLDSDDRLYHSVWAEFSSSIRVLLNNPYIFQPFWDYQNGKIPETEWQTRFQTSKRKASTALGRRDTVAVLSVVFRRIYTLRNQIIHGGATWNSQANRAQLNDCIALLSKVIPVVIDLMMDHPEQLWGDAFYPFLADD